MKRFLHKLSTGLLAVLMLFIMACEKITILNPPDAGSNEKTGTGKSDARSILFVLNDTSTYFVDPASYDTHIVTDNVLNYFVTDEFARPLNVSDPNNLSLDILPVPKTNAIMELQDPCGNLEQSEFLGAFSSTVQEDWHISSNWWVLNPQDIDYGYDEESVVTISGRITQNTTWTSDHKYLLVGQVFIEDGVTLTIEPGTIIFGQNAEGINAGVLCFNRGSKINANGTADEPIIFTGTSNPGERIRGQWGGVIFLGKATNAKGTDVLVEGIEGSETYDGYYGGTDDDDDSGEFSYWRVEYAGLAVNPGNELNSITFGSVGSSTTAHHIIISGAGDDAMEWFGGSIDLTYVATYNTLDDDLDMDSGFSGSLQYVYMVRNPYAADESGAACMEVSSSKTVGIEPQTTAKVSNVTMVGSVYQLKGTELFADPKYQGGMYSKEDAAVLLTNSIIIGAPVGVQNP